MKKAILNLCVSGMVVLGFTAMRELAAPSITGKVTPADAADAVWAIKDADTVKSAIGADGAFKVEVTPGTWRVVINAKTPYKNAEVGPVEAAEDKTTDVGEIKLEQ